MATRQGKLLNIDTALKPLSEHEVTAEIIDARVKSLSFKNLDDCKGPYAFAIDCCTCTEAYWLMLVGACSTAYFARKEKKYVLVFEQSSDCGCIRTYTTCHAASFTVNSQCDLQAKPVASVTDIYMILDTEAVRTVYARWIDQQEEATKLPTEFVTGRLSNTNVTKAFIATRGCGCVVCGLNAACYAATTFGDVRRAVLLQLPVCKEHLTEAKQHPNVFAFFASLFQLDLDIGEIEKLSHIPDESILYLHLYIAEELGGRIGRSQKTARGWELWIELSSGWKWLLRLGSLTDFAYILFEPGVKQARYRSDSAPDHRNLKFFPVHEHTSPGRKSDTVKPSFLYGYPLLDVRRFLDVGEEWGAYGPCNKA